MTDNISKIKDRLSVIDVVSGYLKLQKAGVNFKAPCPFHNEKTPSFFVSPERQMWKCFGCGKGGSIFDFIMEMEGVEFPEALRLLAAKAGIELEEFDSTIKDSKNRLYQICETSTRFFEKQLSHSDTGRRAVEYLKSRGLGEATRTKFRLGFAPDTWDALSKYLRNSGFTEKEIIDAGVVIKRESKGIYDRFRSRIIFPIADISDRVVGFTGRIFRPAADIAIALSNTDSPRPAAERPSSDSVEPTADVDVPLRSVPNGTENGSTHGQLRDGVAKYINTPQTLIYDKSRILYGLNHSRTDIRKRDKCLLVEGNMDVIMSYQAGVTNVVASSGTALTPMHLGILKRYTDNLDFCFDTDSAGTLATKRGIGMALGQNINVKVVSINDKECKDPADYVKKYGKEWEKVVSSAKPILEFYFDKARENYNPESVESKKNVIMAVAPFIKRLSSRVERAHWVNQLAYFLRVKEDAVEADVMSTPDLERPAAEIEPKRVERPSQRDKGDSFSTEGNVWSGADNSGTGTLNEALLSLVVRKPALFKEDITTLDKGLLSPLASQVLGELEKEKLEQFRFGDFVAKFNSDNALDLEFIYLRSQALWDDFKDDELKMEFSNILNKLKQKTINLRLVDLGYEMRAAEATGNKTKIGELAVAFNKLTQELAEIHRI